MIIGISGKIGSGKDTVGRIIQYLVAENNFKLKGHVTEYKDYTYTLQEFLQGKDIYNKIYTKDYTESISEDSNWQIKKFAGKLKQIVSILTGIPVEDLEKQEVKDSYLSVEWAMYKYAIGFNTDNNGNKSMIMEWCDKEKYEEENRINWQTAYSYLPKVRELLQWIGTEAMRDVIHPNCWLNALFSEYFTRVNEDFLNMSIEEAKKLGLLKENA